MTVPTTGSTSDMLSRLKAVLPLRWFPDATPVLDGVLAGLAATAATLFSMLGYIRLQTRVTTVTDSFVDTAANDYCGRRIVRRATESDTALRWRLRREMLRDRATRTAMISVLSDLTGRVPHVFEPCRPADTGAYGAAAGYAVAGAWGSMVMPFQCLVTAYRPLPAGSPAWSGGSGPGAPVSGSTVVIEGLVTDAEILASVTSNAPIAVIAWTAISN